MNDDKSQSSDLENKLAPTDDDVADGTQIPSENDEEVIEEGDAGVNDTGDEEWYEEGDDDE